MLESDEEIYLTAIKGALLITFLVIIIIVAIVKYYTRLKNHLQEVNELESNYQQEILKTQIEIQEQTFNNISQEIHDNLGQSLSLVKLNLNRLKLECIDKNIEKVDDMINEIGKVINDLRSLSKSLNSDYLIHQNLNEAIKFEMNRIKKTGLFSIEIIENGEILSIDPKKKLIIIRTIQEVLNNIIKHAEANKISVILKYTSSNLLIQIVDNGKGFDTKKLSNSESDSTRGVGIYNMFHRIKLIDGSFGIKSSIGSGTNISIDLPIPN